MNCSSDHVSHPKQLNVALLAQMTPSVSVDDSIGREHLNVLNLREADGELSSFCRLLQVLVIEQKNEDGTWPRGSSAPK